MKIILFTLLGLGAFLGVILAFFLLTKYWSDKFLKEKNEKRRRKE